MLTKRACDQAKFNPDGPGQQIIYDGSLPGFGLRIHPTGRKSFVVRYRTRSGRQRYHTIARYGVATVEEARTRARRLLLAVADGEDPVSERRRERAGLTLREFCGLYMDQYAKPKKRTWREDERRINTRIVPAIGSRKLRDVTRADAEALHVRIGGDGGGTEANRVLTLLGRIYSLAEEWGYLPEGFRNPARGVRRFPEKARRRFVGVDEMPRLLEAISKESSPHVRAALLLLLLTGCRRSELLGAQWEDVDWNRRILRLPETKSGEEQVVPLSGPALAILELIPRQHDNPYVFPSPIGVGKHLVDLKKPWRRIRDEAGLTDLRIHDLRRTVGSWMVENGASQALVGEVLRQSSPEATAIYTQIAQSAAARALEAHGQALLEAAGSPEALNINEVAE